MQAGAPPIPVETGAPPTPVETGVGLAPVPSSAPLVLRKRTDFLAANRGGRAVTPGFILLVRRREDGLPTMRVGFTVTRKIGNAVTRNRLKRRLREVARLALPGCGHAGADHVLIGREAGLTRDFAAMQADLVRACARLA